MYPARIDGLGSVTGVMGGAITCVGTGVTLTGMAGVGVSGGVGLSLGTAVNGVGTVAGVMGSAITRVGTGVTLTGMAGAGVSGGVGLSLGTAVAVRSSLAPATACSIASSIVSGSHADPTIRITMLHKIKA